jgi:hypothetical protein
MISVQRQAKSGEAVKSSSSSSSSSTARSALESPKSPHGGKSSDSEESEERKKLKAKAGLLQRRAADGDRPPAVPAGVQEALRSPGKPLDARTRAFMEPRFGHDFSNVRVHDDAQAAASARAVNAHAYTVGNDIVFDSGRYDASSETGRRLLAHELAHTIQQRGLQRSSAGVSLPSQADDGRLEHEAEHAAKAAVARQPSAMPPLKRVGEPVLSRRKGSGEDPGAKPEDGKENDEPDNVQSNGGLTNSFGNWFAVKRLNKNHPKGSQPAESTKTNEHWRKLNLRATPSGRGDYYIRGHLLNDNLGGPGDMWENLTPLTSVANNKSSESHLHKFEDHVKDAVNQNDKTVDFIVSAIYGRAGRTVDETKLTSVDAGQRQMVKEIVAEEKNVPTKLICSAIDVTTNQPVDQRRPKTETAGQNAGETGKKIDERVEIENTIDENPESYHLNEQKVAAYQKDFGTGKKSGESPPGAGAGMETYTVGIKGRTATFSVKPGIGDTDLANQPGAGCVEGLTLKTLHRGKKQDVIDAVMNTNPEAKGGGKKGPPVAIPEKDNLIPLLVDSKTRELSHQNKKTKIPIEYKPLSPGIITELNIDEAGGISGAGTISPSIPLLKGVELGIKFSGEELSVTTQIPKEKLKALPGMRVTKAELAMELSPEFKPSGTLDFEIGPKGKPVANGQIAVSADAQGFLAQGELTAHIPGLDEAKGMVTYRKETGWTGGFDITKSGKEFIQRAAVHVGFSDRQGLEVNGELGVKLPGDQNVTVTVGKKGDSWIFAGDGQFQAPGGMLEPVLIHFSYDGEHLEGSGETGVKFRGLDGRLKVRYHNGKISGEGTLNVNKGRANGKIHVKMSPEQKFSGEGEITYKVTENLIATAGIKIDENEKVTLKGALEFPKPIELFKPFQGDYQIFSVGVSIPIPGASIGPLGVKARIEGGLRAGYHVGPGELRNLKVMAMFNPLEDKPDPDLQMHGELYISAGAHISGSISGSIVLDAVVASASGGLTVTATALLDGHVASQVDLHYQQGRFEVKADFELMLGLALKLALDAFVEAQAGIAPFKVETRKDWNLAAYTFDTGMQLGMKTKSPLYYASDQPFQPPSLDQIEITKPQLDVSSLLAKVFQTAGGTEKTK